jgi:hypothetical protein
VEHPVDMIGDDWSLYKGIVRDDMNMAPALAGRKLQERFNNKLKNKRAVLSPGKADYPRDSMRLKVLVANVCAGRLEFLLKSVDVIRYRDAS